MSHRDWREGVEALRARIASLPGDLRRFATRPDPELPVDPGRIRDVWVTGVGNSAAHGRFLADILHRDLGVPARFVATGALAHGRPKGHARGALIVFSQGLSPNARFALTAPGRWSTLILVTATGDAGGTQADREEKAALLGSLRKAGAAIVRYPGEDEYGTLLRVRGPMLAYAAALAVGRSFGRAWGRDVGSLTLDAAAIQAAWKRAPQLVASAFPGAELLHFGRDLSFLTSGGYGERVQGLRHKFLEGMGLPWPPLWDLLDFAHGPFQEHADRACEIVVLARSGAPAEESLLFECKRMLDPQHHRLRILRAELRDPLSVFEHEAQGNHLVLRWLAERKRDPRCWAGQGRDAPLYERSPGAFRELAKSSADFPSGGRPRKRHQTKGTQKA